MSAAQSRLGSLVESIAQALAAVAMSLLATAFVLPLFGIVLSLRDNVVATLVMTVLHVLRQYAIRRCFVAIGERRWLWRSMSG